ncbi:MAG: MYXO-CTERM sorting domain-containing protein, partial [Myxococcaceae bacterium]
ISLYSKVTVAPSSITVDTNKQTTLVATVDGAAKTGGVSWTVTPSSGASVTSGGVFTATTAGTYQVIATSVVDKTKSGVASVTAQNGGGCSTTAGPFTGLLPIVALIGWLLWRRRPSPVP